MYTLYGMTGSCSMAVHVILNELNVPFTVEDVRAPEGQPRPAAFLKLNPRGSVPVLVLEDGTAVREGGAIISYLLDAHQSPMMPKSGSARAKALEWLMFANATMHPAYGRVFFLMGAIKDTAAKEQAIDAALGKINQLWADVDAELATRPFLTGNDASAADILLSVIANWLQANYSSKIQFGPHVQRMIQAVSARPSFQKALAAEHVEYKAAKAA